jgi:hypothetical protein
LAIVHKAKTTGDPGILILRDVSQTAKSCGWWSVIK